MNNLSDTCQTSRRGACRNVASSTAPLCSTLSHPPLSTANVFYTVRYCFMTVFLMACHGDDNLSANIHQTAHLFQYKRHKPSLVLKPTLTWWALCGSICFDLFVGGGRGFDCSNVMMLCSYNGDEEIYCIFRSCIY